MSFSTNVSPCPLAGFRLQPGHRPLENLIGLSADHGQIAQDVGRHAGDPQSVRLGDLGVHRLFEERSWTQDKTPISHEGRQNEQDEIDQDHLAFTPA